MVALARILGLCLLCQCLRSQKEVWPEIDEVTAGCIDSCIILCKVTCACGSLLDGCLRMADMLGDAARVDAVAVAGLFSASGSESGAPEDTPVCGCEARAVLDRVGGL